MARDTSNKRSTGLIGSAALASAAAASVFSFWYIHRLRRSRWSRPTQEESKEGDDTRSTELSILSQYLNVVLDKSTTVSEANKRRTTSYYEKSREAHLQSLVLGVSSSSALAKLRQREMDNILRYWKKGNLSHRTIVVMCDEKTSSLLDEARTHILGALKHSSDLGTRGVWIPDMNIIPLEDMHVTVAIAWWWHTIKKGNEALTREIAQRFRQTLLLSFHYPFQIELERIVLLGGKDLVALWRCVGSRWTELEANCGSATTIHDRHGETTDPMVRLREEIVRCYTSDLLGEPLTYQYKKEAVGREGKISDTPPATVERQSTIEKKTPGMAIGAAPGKADGFIHTSLCRLPLDCLSSQDVELEDVHRLCREATAMLAGHRMVVSKYRFLETTGEGGVSNPCHRPLYDETIDAPLRQTVDIDGKSSVTMRPHRTESLSIGPMSNFWSELEQTESNGNKHDEGGKVMPTSATNLLDLFKKPE